MELNKTNVLPFISSEKLLEGIIKSLQSEVSVLKKQCIQYQQEASCAKIYALELRSECSLQLLSSKTRVKALEAYLFDTIPKVSNKRKR